jgi:hypothetical protein
MLKGKFASSVFQSSKEKTPKTRKLISGPQCVNMKQILSGRCKYSIFDIDISQTCEVHTIHLHNQLAGHKLCQTHKGTLLHCKIVCVFYSV